MGETLIPLLATALPLMGSPGPATLSLAGVGVAFGVTCGMPYLLGIQCGTMLVLIIVASGLAGLVLALPGVLPVVSAVALAYILYLAVRIATAPPPARGRQTGARPSFAGGLLLALGNPKAYAAIGAVCSSVIVVVDSVALDAIAKVLTLSTLILVINLIWLGFGAAFASVLSNPVLSRTVNIGFAVLLVLSVLGAVLV